MTQPQKVSNYPIFTDNEDQEFLFVTRGFSSRIKEYPVNDELKVLLQEFDQAIEAFSEVSSREIPFKIPGSPERIRTRSKLYKVFYKIIDLTDELLLEAERNGTKRKMISSEND